MYFVVIDLNQLRTRIQNSTRVDFVNPQHWLEDRQFVRSAEGWLASADSMNLLSCSEIVYSERRSRPPEPVIEAPRPVKPAKQSRRRQIGLGNCCRPRPARHFAADRS